MASDGSSYASSTYTTSSGEAENTGAPAIPDEEVMRAFFSGLCTEICLAFWISARSDQHARRVGREEAQYRRRLSRMSLTEVQAAVARELNPDIQRCMRSTVHALSSNWMRPLSDSDLNCLSAAWDVLLCPDRSWVLATFSLVFSQMAVRIQLDGLSSDIVRDCIHLHLECQLYVRLTVFAVKILDLDGRRIFLEMFSTQFQARRAAARETQAVLAV